MQKPCDYIINKFQKHDVVLLGEHHAVKDNLNFVMTLIPKLYAAGVYQLGMEFGCYEDQETLDHLVTGDVYDEALARELMYRYNVRWAYVEYMDIYRAAWAFNQTLEPNVPRFRILNLSYAYDWREFTGVRTPLEAQKIFHKGNTEWFRFNVIENEVLHQHEKILVLTGTPHAFTRYKFPTFSGTANNFVTYEGDWLGNRLYEAYGNRIFTIMFHQWFQDAQTYRFVSPANGEIEAIMHAYGNLPQGFDLVGTDMGQLRDDSSYSFGYPNFTLADMFDGYIYLKPLTELQGAQVDYQFIEEKSFKEVQANFPDKDWTPVPNSIEDYWKIIEAYVAY